MRIAMTRSRSIRLAGATLRTVVLFCLSFIVLYPVLYLLSMAFRNPIDLLDPSVIWIPNVLTLATITKVGSAMAYGSTLGSSLLFAGVSSFLSLATCSLTGYGFARFRFRGSRVLFGLLLFSIVVPAQTIAIPLFQQLRFFDFFSLGRLLAPIMGYTPSLNLYNTPAAVYLPALFGAGIRSSLYIYIFRQFFKGLPQDLEDAANIDGAGFLKTFLRIIVPTATPPYLVVAILSFIWYWNDVLWIPLFYPKYLTLSVAVDTIANRIPVPRGQTLEFFDLFVYQRTACLLLILPVLLLYMVVQRQFIQSVDRTGLK